MSTKAIPTELKKQMQHAIVKETDIQSNELRTEIIDSVIAGVDKYNAMNNEASAKMIKENLDRQYGPNWTVIIGRGFAFDVSSHTGSLMLCYYQGELGLLVYKS